MSVNPETPATPDNTGRDAKGRFAKGNPGGPGNPFARQTAELRTALLRVDATKIGAIADKIVEQAMEGDVPSAKLIFAYCIGKATPAVNPDEVEVLEFEHFKRYKVPPAEVSRVTGDVPAKWVNTMMRATTYASERTFADMTLDAFAQQDKGVDGATAAENAIQNQLDKMAAPRPAPEDAPPPEAEPEPVPCEVKLPLPGAIRVPANTVSKPGSSDRRAANPSQQATPDRNPAPDSDAHKRRKR